MTRMRSQLIEHGSLVRQFVLTESPALVYDHAPWSLGAFRTLRDLLMLLSHTWWLRVMAAALLAVSASSFATTLDVAASDRAALDATVAAACERQVVLLGEATHGDGHADEVKAALVERLVAQCGFDTVLFESGVYEFIPVARVARSGRPVPPALVAAAVGGLWGNDQELQPLLAILAARAGTHQVTLGGLDFQVGGIGQPYANDSMFSELTEGLPSARRDACRRLFRSLVYGEDAPDGTTDHARVETLQACVADAATTPPGGVDADIRAEQRLALENVEGWLAQVDDSPAALARARDRAMATNVDRFLDRHGRAAKIVVWTHNGHAAKDGHILCTDYSDAPNLGAALARRLGSRVFALGLTARSGVYRWSRNTDKPLPPAPPDALESRFDGGTTHGSILVTAADLRSAGACPAGLLGHVYKNASWATVFDAVLVLDMEHAPHALRP